MPRKPQDFTENMLRTLPIETGEYVVADRGLRLRIYPSGTKAWSYFKTAPNGQRKTISLGTYPSVSLKQARALADRSLGEMLKTGHDIATNKKGIIFGAYISSKSYLSWSKSNRKAHSTIMQNLQNLVPVWFHRKSLDVFTNDDFQLFVDGRLKEGVKEQTINRNLNNIRSVFKRAFLDHTLKNNPMDRFQNLKEPEVAEKLSFTDDERRRLITAARDRTLPQAKARQHMEFFIELGLQTGMRKGELHAIKWKHFKNESLETVNVPEEIFKDSKSRLFQQVKRTITHMTIDNSKDAKKQVDIDFKEENELRWYVDVDGTFTKSGKSRTIPVPDELIKRLREYLWSREEESIHKKFSDAAFPDENLNIVRTKDSTVMSYFEELDIIPYKDCKTAFQSLHKLAGLPKGTFIHTMRHDFCTRKIKQKIDIYTVKRLAGHQDIRTTMRYLHALDSKDFSAFDKLDHNLI